MTIGKRMAIMTLYSVYYDGDDLIIIMSLLMMITMIRIMMMIAMMCN